MERIVLIGGPSTGKTSLVNALAAHGQLVQHEISRAVIKAAQQEGIEQLFLKDPLLFSQKLLNGRINQFNHDFNNANRVFYDRGIPDVLAYMNYAGQHYPESFEKACKTYRYDRVFILPPWQEIHTTDAERYEDYETAATLHGYLLDCYKSYAYTPIEVPRCSVEERVNFILNNL